MAAETGNINTIIIAILSSSLLAAFIASLVNGVFSILLKKREYQYIFFQDVIKKRIETYEFIESQIAVLKTTAVDNDGSAYHLIFAYDEDKFYELQQNLFLAKSKGIWLSEKTGNLLTELNYLFLQISHKYDLSTQLEEAGKNNYQIVATLRTRLEASFIEDFATLNDVKKFLKNKKIDQTSFNTIELQRKP